MVLGEKKNQMSDLACKITRHLSMFGPKTPETDPEKAAVLTICLDIPYFTVQRKHLSYKTVYTVWRPTQEQMSCMFGCTPREGKTSTQQRHNSILKSKRHLLPTLGSWPKHKIKVTHTMHILSQRHKYKIWESIKSPTGRKLESGCSHFLSLLNLAECILQHTGLTSQGLNENKTRTVGRHAQPCSGEATTNSARDNTPPCLLLSLGLPKVNN